MSPEFSYINMWGWLKNREQKRKDDAFSVVSVLKSKGFETKRVGSLNKTLLPKAHWTNRETAEMFSVFNDTEKRNLLLEYVKNQGTNVQDKNVLALIHKPEVQRLFKREKNEQIRQRFSTSFEWYVGELMVRHFGAFSSSHGVEIRNIMRNSTQTYSGDYDVLSVMRDTKLMYFECKTGGYNRSGILKAIERGLSLHTKSTVMFISQKINEKSLKSSLEDAVHPLGYNMQLRKVEIKNSKTSIYFWQNCYFISDVDNIEEQLRTVLRVVSARDVMHIYGRTLDENLYASIGYVIRDL